MNEISMSGGSQIAKLKVCVIRTPKLLINKRTLVNTSSLDSSALSSQSLVSFQSCLRIWEIHVN